MAKVTAGRHARVQHILEQLRCWETVKATSLRDHLLARYFPRPIVELGEGVERTKATDDILKTLNRAIERSTLNLPILGPGFATTDFLSYVWPIVESLNLVVAKDADLAARLSEANAACSPLRSPELVVDAVQNLFRELDNEVARFCRIDTGLFHLMIHHGWTEHKKWTVRFTLHSARPRIRTVVPQGPPKEPSRPAYWCGQPHGVRGIHWLEWDPTRLGLPPGPSLPVYVQDHALDTLYRKEARALFIEDGEWLVHDYLWVSLRAPVIHPLAREPGKFLVEYRLNIHKIGYLLVEATDGVVLVRTFLFLTMNGTPEGDKFWQTLRLGKEGKKHLQLDRIQTFLGTDLQFDTELVTLLDKCGCGHLFRVLKEVPRERLQTGVAAEIREYLKLKPLKSLPS